MHVGFLTDGLGHLPLLEALDVVASLDLREIEFATGNWSNSPHLSLQDLLASEEKRDALLSATRARGLTIGALNASGNVLHPISGPDHDRVVRDTMRLANFLGVKKIVMMSGLPAVFEGDKVTPWITTCWPPENGVNLELQWKKAEEYWPGLVEFAKEQGIEKIAIEMHADQLVFNAPTLLRLRSVAGAIVGANMDPSHLMWMGADPIKSVEMLKGAIHHVHAKDTRIEKLAAVRTTLETLFFDKIGERAWNYVTLGEGHPRGEAFWADFCNALRGSGYDGVLSIEHEDVAHTPVEGLTIAVDVLKRVI